MSKIIAEKFPSIVTDKIEVIRKTYQILFEIMKETNENCSNRIKIFDSNRHGVAEEQFSSSITKDKMIKLDNICRSFLAKHESLIEMYNERSVCFGWGDAPNAEFKDLDFALEFVKDKMVFMKCINYLDNKEAAAGFLELEQLKSSIEEYSKELVLDMLAEVSPDSLYPS